MTEERLAHNYLLQ